MYLFHLLALLILDAVGRIEAWIESSVLDNDESPLVTTLGLCLALLVGLWGRYVVPLFRIGGYDPGPGKTGGEEQGRPAGEDLESAEYRFDLHGRLVHLPRGAQAWMGSDREAAIGAPLSRFLLAQDVPAVIDGFVRVLRGESVVDLGVRLRGTDGSLVRATMDLFPVVNAGEIEQVRGVLKTVPGQTRAARSEVSVYIVGKGRMLFVNPRFEESSGYARGDLSSVDPMQIIHPADRSRVRRSNIELLKGDQPSACDFRIVTRDGRVRWVRARVRPVTYKGERAILGNFVVMPAREEPVQRSRGRGDCGRTSAPHGCSASA